MKLCRILFALTCLLPVTSCTNGQAPSDEAEGGRAGERSGGGGGGQGGEAGGDGATGGSAPAGGNGSPGSGGQDSTGGRGGAATGGGGGSPATTGGSGGTITPPIAGPLAVPPTPGPVHPCDGQPAPSAMAYVSRTTSSGAVVHLFISRDLKPGDLRGVFVQSLRDAYSVDMFLDPEWRTFWTLQRFAVIYLDTRNNWDAAAANPAFLQTLSALATDTGFGELATAPFISWGHSASSTWNTAFAKANAARMLAYYTYHTRVDGRERILGDAGATATELAIPYLYKSGRMDANQPAGNANTLEFEKLIPLGRSASRSVPLTAGMDPDLPHGSGLYTSAIDPTNGKPLPLTNADSHLRHGANETRTPERLYNFMSSRAGFEMAWLSSVIALRQGADGIRAIDQTAGWLGNALVDDQKLWGVAGNAGALTPPFGDGPTGQDIKPHAMATADERRSWIWLPNQVVAELWQWYFSAGHKGEPSPGVNVQAATGETTTRQGESGLTLKLTRSGAWSGNFNNNRIDTTQFVKVAAGGTAVLGKDYVFEGALAISPALGGIRQAVAFDFPADVSPATRARYACFIPPSSVRFWNKTPFAYVGIRPINPSQEGDKTVVFRIEDGDGYQPGNNREVTITIRAK